ncbi:MAG: acetate--CoA ligase family protein [Thermoanaerobacteraceae bacterium]|nr:acetate--CoA ligase family protein [Thermoanaerobacteraceae bacterium]
MEVGYPVVLKVRSPFIAHKSDSGGVVLNLANGQQVRRLPLRSSGQGQGSDPGRLRCSPWLPEPGGVIGFTVDRQFSPCSCAVSGVSSREVLARYQ